MPIEIVEVLHQQLVLDMDWAVKNADGGEEERKSLDFGAFVNFMGTVEEVNHEKGKLSVMVSIFGRDTRVDDLEFWQVEEAPVDAEVE